MHQSLQGATFHVEHVIPRCRGGASNLANLVLACPGCNLHKSDKLRAVDAETGEDVELFHPIREAWAEHFRFDGNVIERLSPRGRATIALLQLNSVRRLRIREVERAFGLHGV
jgi:hypothetical protein